MPREIAALLPLVLLFGAFLVVIFVLSRKSLDIKSKTVGDGQHGSASFATPKEISKGITSLQGHMTSNSTAFVQWAAAEALRSCDDAVEAMRQEFAKRRDYFYEKLCALPGITCVKPGGAFYLMPDVSFYFGKKADGRTIENSSDFCDYILQEAKVAIVPGSAFGMPKTVRIAYTESMERIQEGLERLEKALGRLQ